MRARITALAGTAAALALVTGLLLMPLPPAWEGPWQSKLFDLGHVPLFGVLTLLLWWLLNRSWAAAIGIALTLGALAELIQDYFGRTGSLLDFLRDVLGCAVAFVVVRAWQGRRTFLGLASHALVVAALVAWPIADAAPQLLDAYEGYRSFPTLADFATTGQMIRWQARQAKLERVPDSEQPSGWSARLTFLPGVKRYPTAYLEPAVRDWSGYRRLCCSFTVTEGPLRVVFSVRGRDASGESTHYQDPHERTYAPGAHVLRADLDTIACKAKPTPLDLASVHYFVIFTYRPAQDRTIYLHRIWLE